MDKQLVEPCDVLVICAHPDDAEMAMGGTLICLVNAGYKVQLVSLTPSQMSTYGNLETRKKEAEAAAAIIGCRTRILDMHDTQLENDTPTRERVVELIRSYRPRIVFTIYHTNPMAELGGIAHRDHYTCGAIVRDAVKLARLEKVMPHVPKHTVSRLYFFMLPRNVYPTMVVDVSHVIDKTMEAIRAYGTQMQIHMKDNDVEYSLRTSRAAVGLTIGVKFAEGFITDIPLRLTADVVMKL